MMTKTVISFQLMMMVVMSVMMMITLHDDNGGGGGGGGSGCAKRKGREMTIKFKIIKLSINC